MSRAGRTLLVYGIYLVVAGLGFVLIPNVLLRLFGFPATVEPWIRTTGLLAAIVGYFDIQAARHELTPFFGWSVHARGALFVVFVGLVMLRLARPMLLLCGTIDLLSAAWTYLALRR
jgi:hypothetical protein